MTDSALPGLLGGADLGSADAVIAGAGIVGASCAWRLARLGLRVVIVDPGPAGGGATAAGMGHIMVSDDSPAQFALTRLSRDLWDELAPELPADAERVGCGALWVAENDEELHAARAKAAFYTAHGVAAEMLDPSQLRAAEPNLRPGLLGGLRLPEDSIVYPPCVVRWMLSEVARRSPGGVVIGPQVVRMGGGEAVLSDGRRVRAPLLVNALGVRAPELSPWAPVRRRKGHLLITDRHPGFCTHEIVELGYLKAAHGHSEEAVAFNLQMRATGQLLLGSTRQYGRETSEVEPRIVRRLVDRALQFMPRLAELSVLRAWTGFRAATPDSLPLIGPDPGDQSLFLATGHEGLGITTALGTAALLAAHVRSEAPPIPAEPYWLTRARLGLTPAPEVAHA